MNSSFDRNWIALKQVRSRISNMWNRTKDRKWKAKKNEGGGSQSTILQYLGPGLLVTVGFIDPGNWASNLAAGSFFGYSLLWVVTLSTLMLIFLQHNVARLGIVTGLCLSEAATEYTPRLVSVPVLASAMVASVSTSLAEIIGGAIALQMLFHIPLVWGSLIMVLATGAMIFVNTYGVIEKVIAGFVSIIGLSFLYELYLVPVDWAPAAAGWVLPSLPEGSIWIVMSVLGAVVMPHNLFLHSEIIQSRKWDLDDPEAKRIMDYELSDTVISMGVGWAINSAMVILAASAFYSHQIRVEELEQARALLIPLVGSSASAVFAVALLFAGIASTVTSAMAGGSIFAGIFGHEYDVRDNPSRWGIFLSLAGAFAIILMVRDSFQALLISQIVLSVQLPWTVGLQVFLTSSPRVMGAHRNSPFMKGALVIIAVIVTVLNGILFWSLL